MSIPYSELLAETLGLLEIDSDDADRFKIDENLRQSQRRLLNTLDRRWLVNAIKTSKFNITSGTRDYQYPSDYWRFVELWVNFTTEITISNPGNKCTVFETTGRHVKNIEAIASVTYPFVDIDTEGGLAIYPVPTADVTNGARIRYVYDMPAPTSSQDCLLEPNLKNLLVYNTVRLSALIEEHNVKLADEMLKLYTEEVQAFLPKETK